MLIKCPKCGEDLIEYGTKCPNCGFEFWANEVDVDRCPECNVRLTGWEIWHRLNDNEVEDGKID